LAFRQPEKGQILFFGLNLFRQPEKGQILFFGLNLLPCTGDVVAEWWEKVNAEEGIRTPKSKGHLISSQAHYQILPPQLLFFIYI
jgi:hypothetical protein